MPPALWSRLPSVEKGDSFGFRCACACVFMCISKAPGNNKYATDRDGCSRTIDT